MAPLCFGGSFNPIHHGHMICARAVAEAGGYSRIVLIPTAQPPHKQEDTQIAPASARLEMCRLAVEGSSLFQVNGVELERDGPSYTLDTAALLRQQGWGRIPWLIGADMLLYLPKWHRAAELLQAVDFVIMARPGWHLDWQTLPPEFRHLQANVVEAPLIDISASDIRHRVAAGRSIEYLTPPSVCRYIREHGLYR